MARIIYLDHAATTPTDPEIVRGFADRELTLFGNPESTHALGRAAAKAHDEARARLARALGGKPGEVIFTGGGTEAMGLAILGLAGETPGHIAFSAVEHSCVVEAAARLVRLRGWTQSTLPVDAEGRVDPATLAEHLDPRARLVAIMLANNEIGTVNDIAKLARAIRARAPRAKLVVDAVQAFGKLPFDVNALDADCVAITAHKLHGPKGIGALWTRVGIEPVFRGGGQEGGRRGGTQSAPLAWAFAEAVERQLTDAEKVTALRDRLWANVQALLPEIRLTGAPPGPGRLGNNLHFCVPGLPSGPLLNALAAAGLCASAGSACGHGRFSRVLAAIGRQPDDGAFLRLSPGRFTTEDEIDAAAAIVADAVAQLRPVYAR